jgi:hypothetical protein
MCGLPGPEWDTETPPAGDCFFHLVTAVVNGVEGGLGTDSAGQPRPNGNPCPAP